MSEERFEGGWDSKLTQFIRETGRNKDIDIRLGTVKTAPPKMRINVDGMKYDLDADDYVIAEHLTARTEQLTINGALSTVEHINGLKVGDRIIVLSSHNGQRYYVIGKAVTY